MDKAALITRVNVQCSQHRAETVVAPFSFSAVSDGDEATHAPAAKDAILVGIGRLGTLPYIGKSICLPSGEQEKNGYHGYHGYHVIQKSEFGTGLWLPRSRASGASRGSPLFECKRSLDSIWTPVLVVLKRNS